MNDGSGWIEDDLIPKEIYNHELEKAMRGRLHLLWDCHWAGLREDNVCPIHYPDRHLYNRRAVSM